MEEKKHVWSIYVTSELNQPHQQVLLLPLE